MQYTKDEQVLVDGYRNIMKSRADFFNDAAARHPNHAQIFNALASAAQDMATMIFVPAQEIDPAFVESVSAKYQTGLMGAFAAGLLPELEKEQKLLIEAIDEFDSTHPELMPVKKALEKKLGR